MSRESIKALARISHGDYDIKNFRVISKDLEAYENLMAVVSKENLVNKILKDIDNAVVYKIDILFLGDRLDKLQQENSKLKKEFEELKAILYSDKPMSVRLAAMKDLFESE